MRKDYSPMSGGNHGKQQQVSFAPHRKKSINFHYRVKRDRSRSNVTIITPYEARQRRTATATIKEMQLCPSCHRRAWREQFLGLRGSLCWQRASEQNIIVTNMSSQFLVEGGREGKSGSELCALTPKKPARNELER